MPSSDEHRSPVPTDYNTEPARFASNQLATACFASGDVHAPVAERLASAPLSGPVLDLGGGNGTLTRLLRSHRVPAVVFDQADYVTDAPRPVVLGDARHLPFRNASFGAVAAMWMLYHLDVPTEAIREAARVLPPGGTFVSSCASRYDDPEVRDWLPEWGKASTFDAENAVEQVASYFSVTDVVTWDEPLIQLPDEAALTIFMRGRGLSNTDARTAADHFKSPLSITKRGCVIWATKP